VKQVLQYPKRGELRIEDVPAPALKTGGVVIENSASLLSAGTERAIIEMTEKSVLGKAKERPDLVRQVIQKVRTEGALNTYRKVKSRLDAPAPLGYSCAGVITEVSPEINDLAVGQRVAAAGFGYASHANVVFVPRNLTAVIPDNVSTEEASFVTLGAIALQGVRQANPTLGETIAVVGMGLLGQLTAQMLKANGCLVVGMDIDNAKLKLGQKLGCASVINNTEGDPVGLCQELTGGRGVDRVIITAASASPALMNMAAEICRERGHITVVGAVKMDLDRRPFYNKELSLNLSRSYGPGRYDNKYEEQGHDYPVSYVRWTERRNMECFLQMISNGSANVRDLITHRFPIAEATAGYDMIMGRASEKDFLGVILNYGANESSSLSATVTAKTMAIKPSGATTNTHMKNSPMKLGAIGSGSFSTGVLYPLLQNLKTVDLHTIVTSNGVNAMNTARQFGFANAGTSFDELLRNQEVSAILIATPHNVHTEQVIASLESGKDVFVEKPLATTKEELDNVISAYSANPGNLMVGFNRRYSPAALAVKKHLIQTETPAMYVYRINAGFIPKESTLQDDTIGKGRLIGEACHFIDLINYLAGATPQTVFAEGVGFTTSKFLTQDNVNMTMKLSDGSTAVIVYTASGGAGLPKEALEVHCAGSSYVLDDFKSAVMHNNGKITKLWSGAQDKGHKAELATFATLQRGSETAQEIAEAGFCATDVTLAVVESLRTNQIVTLNNSRN
jgi:predicted dehydrogenase/threonine dehydrogenase-like Zn-dependent dehydrogenase